MSLFSFLLFEHTNTEFLGSEEFLVSLLQKYGCQMTYLFNTSLSFQREYKSTPIPNGDFVETNL